MLPSSLPDGGVPAAPAARRLSGPPTLPGAAQPDIVRAAQKDELYLQHLAGACNDAVGHLLGPRRALDWARETNALARLLFYGLTTGGGRQTLGEEYCDLLQTAGSPGIPPGRVRRGTLVLLQTLGPYLQERLSRTQPDLEAPPVPQQPSQPPPLQTGVTWLGRLLLRAHAAAGAGAAAWRRVSRVAREYAGVGVRMQLALFYLYGVYYHWSKRLTGVRYVFVGKLFERRPSYYLLGLLLCGQLSITAISWALRNLARDLAGGFGASSAAAAGQPNASTVLQASGPAAKARPAVVLKADSDELEADPQTAVSVLDGADVPASRRCPLCLSARTCPTATPCGHVFCWTCVTAWCQHKAECPLCRTPFEPSGLVCVYHANF